MSKSETTTTVWPVVMAGGSGTRLWPLSRSGFPKQFLVLGGGTQSLFQQAVGRLMGLGRDGGVAVAAGERRAAGVGVPVGLGDAGGRVGVGGLFESGLTRGDVTGE